jgi:hypothetical protein
MEKIFKAKRLDNGEWFEFDLFDGLSAITWEIFDKNTVCQYIGIYAANGKIFEGDELGAEGECNSIVKYDSGEFWFHHETDWRSNWVSFRDIDLKAYTLTGHNIHDKD